MNSLVIPEKANKLQEITPNPTQSIPKSLEQYEPFDSHPFSNPPSDPRGAYFLCHPCPIFKPISTLLAGDEPSSRSTSSELPIPTDLVLPSPYMRDATVQLSQPETLLNPVNQQEEAAPVFFDGNPTSPQESPPQTGPIFTTLTSKVTHVPRTLPPTLSPNLEENVNVREIEETIELMRETRTKIALLKDVKVMIFKERFIKKHTLICPPNLSKSSLDIRVPKTQGRGTM
ncbi:hypothetical protein H5410_062806 [Solanum commersonii]|uniref:Uncharacterized protein n=1 Tax=Solanum commersonii TaxID=4109 RepID=A0A9J5WDE6_SOLCO|nr:hypothetical protein H5410_062806 [Solanum commersonii]